MEKPGGGILNRFELKRKIQSTERSYATLLRTFEKRKVNPVTTVNGDQIEF